MFELYNQAVWPLHIFVVFFSFLIVYALWKKTAWSGRLVASLLVIGWLWVAFAFLYQRFYQIHIVANWYACGFIVQALLIFWYGVFKDQFISKVESRVSEITGLGLLFLSLIFYPVLAFISGRGWLQSEMFLLTPDPTALATIAILVLYKLPKILYVIPAFWLLISITTLMVM